MSNVKIKKAKIKDDLFLEVEFIETLPGHSKKETKMNCTIPVHDDLKSVFGNLTKHLAVLCDELAPAKKIKDIHRWDDEALKNFSVQGFSIGGSEDNEGVTLSGRKEGNYGTINLNTPFQKYAASEYPYISQLGSDIEACIYEVEQYLFEGKRAPERQIALDFEEQPTEEK